MAVAEMGMGRLKEEEKQRIPPSFWSGGLEDEGKIFKGKQEWLESK